MYPRPSISEVKASELTTVSRNPLIGCIAIISIKHYLDSTTVGELPQRLWPYLLACAQIPQKRRWRELSGRGLERLRLPMTAKARGAWGGSDGWADGGIESAGGLDHRLGGWAGVGNG
jgi:hypothetical protein